MLVQFGDFAGVHCKIDDIVIAQNTQYSAVITYKASTNTVAVKLNDQSPVNKQCTADFNLPDFTVSHNKLGAPGYSNTDFFGGTVDGLYVFSRFLEEEQASQVLAAIEIGGPDTLPTLQCCAADGTYTPECGCPANSYGPRKTITSYAEDNFKQGNADDVTSDTVLLSNGFTVELSGWTHTRDYANGYLDNTYKGEATATVVSLTPGMSYEYAIGVWNTVAVYEGYFWVSVNGGTSIQLFQTQTLHNYAGTATAKSDGTIEFKFNNPDNLSMFSVASLRIGTLEICASCPSGLTSPAFSTSISACACADNQQTVAFKNDKLQAWYKLESDGLDSGPHAAHLQTRLSATANFVSGQYLSVSDDVSFLIPREKTGLIIPAGTTELTVSFWVKNWIDGYVMRWVPSNLFFWENSDASKDGEASIEGSTLKTLFTKSSEWTHMLFVFDQTQIVFYENGVFKDHSTTAKIPAGGFVQETDKDAGLFCNPFSASNAHDFRGDIKDIRFYLSAFTSAEARDLYDGVGSCVQCPTDGTVVEGCEPPCVDGTSFSYWSIRKSVCP